jgi:ADP-ribose pyrophosphatase
MVSFGKTSHGGRARLAQGARRKGLQTLDEREDIEVLLKPLADIPRLIREGAITHSLVVAAFYRLFMEHLPPSPR